MNKIAISLGFLCDSAMHRKNVYNFSKENGYLTCPFDTMMSNYKGIIECIKNDFSDFCNKDFIELKPIYNKENELWIYNKKYKFLFNHESPGHANLYKIQHWANGKNHFVDNNFENFIARYETRIKNFIYYLNSDNHIIFIIHRYNNNLEDLSELNNVIKNKYPNLSYEFDLLQAFDYERLYCHELMMGIKDDDLYNECNRFDQQHRFFFLHKDYNYNIYKNFQDENLSLDEHELKMKFLVNYLFNNSEQNKVVFSLKSFYELYPNFDYYLFRNIHSDKLVNYTEEETIIYWYKNFFKLNIDDGINEINKENILNYKKKDIIIYPHLIFDLKDGGVTVQYYLAQVLDKLGIRVRYIDNNLEKNSIFNNVFNLNNPDFIINESIVLYCEGIYGNPLNASNVVRWLLSPLGTNVPYHIIHSFNKNELVYYFNPETRFKENNEGKIFKILTCPYVNPNIKQYNFNERQGSCYTYRKIHFYKSLEKLHNDNDFEITRGNTQEDCIKYFNTYKYFYLYDPLSFLMITSVMCGCIAIVHPVEGLSKLEWLHTTLYSFYLNYKKIDNIYGIAYGVEDIIYAENTIHLAYDQMKDIENCFIEKSVIPFINDIQNFEQNENTLLNNYDL